MAHLFNLRKKGYFNSYSILAENNFITNSIESQAQEIMTLAKKKTGARVVTLNLQILRLIFQSEEFYKNIKTSNYWIADGWPIVTFLKILKFQATRRAGADLVSNILEIKDTVNLKVGYIGGNKELETKIKLAESSSRNKLICISMDQISLPIGNKVRENLTNQIRNLQIDIILVAIGSPKQDYLISGLYETLNDLIYIPCGAALEFHFGTKSRCPHVLQKMNLEWIWRILTEPVRLIPRYFKDGKFFLKFLYFILKNSRETISHV